MAYATVTNIESEFKNTTFTAGEAVTDTEVEDFISEEEAVINTAISNRYEVPVVGTESIKLLRRISVAFVAYRVAKILNLKKDIPIPEKFVAQNLSGGSFYLTAKKQLELIRKGGFNLIDGVPLSTGQGINSNNSANNINSLWKRDTRQW